MKTLKKEHLVIIFMIIAKLTIHTILNINTGFDGDEILHIDSGNHLAWGYMSIQPLVGLMGWVQNLFNSESVFIHHLFSHIAAILIMFFSGLTVMKLGGSWKAVLLALSCILLAPGFILSNHLFTPLVFEQLFWLLSFYALIGYCQKNKPSLLFYLAIFLALGFLSKISILILIAGIGLSVLLYRRDLFTQKVSWQAFAVFLLIVSPNIIWQYQHDFPSVRHMTALYGKILVNIDGIDNLKLLLITTHPLTVIIWFPAIVAGPFLKQTKGIRLAAMSIFIAFFILIAFRGQFHYYFPVILIAISVGSVITEQILKSKTKFILIYVSALLLSSIFLIPRIIPILPLESYIRLLDLDNKESNKNNQLFFTKESILDNKKVNEDERIPINFEAYYTQNDWLNLTEALNGIYRNLPQDKKKQCFIWTRCYTQAGGINLHGKRYDLPQAFSQHGNYSEWIPEFDTSCTIIVVAHAKSPSDSVRTGSFFAPAFEKLEWKNAVFCPYARTSDNAYYMLYLGEGLKYDSDTLIVKYKDYIFE